MSSASHKIMLIYPPGLWVQRGEDRCQINIEETCIQTARACNDLGYAASVLLNKDYDVFLRDYQTENACLEDVISDIKSYKPDIIMISITNTTIFDDLKFVKEIKKYTEAKIVLKGAIFYNPPDEMLELVDLKDVDVVIGGEIDFIIGKVADSLLKNQGELSEINAILYKNADGTFQKTHFGCFEENLDDIPFPARHLMKNELYVRPDTNEALATIQTAKGCPSACIYCLTPDISGKKVRSRSPKNVMEEIRECYEKYGIKNFFFKADTFTIEALWVKELCELIINSDLNNKIEFIANSRVKPLTKETLAYMKKAGCFGVSFGFESGSDDTLKRIKKGAKVHDNLQAAKWAKEAVVPVIGMFVIGFPWETKEHIEETKKHIFKLNPDFIEISLALPFYGTELYDMCKEQNLLDKSVLGSDFFYASMAHTPYFTTQELLKIRKNILSRFYTRPSYIAKKVLTSIKSPKVILNYFKYGFKLLRTLFK